jgi:UDP-N-acetylmuramate--alanine ligase
MEFYGSFDALRRACVTFVENIPFYGLAVLCIDHPEVQALIPQVSDRRIITYGANPQADIRYENLVIRAGRTQFDIAFSGRSAMAGARLDGVALPMAGRHNAQNALAAVAVAQEMGFSPEVIRRGLAGFEGVKRRFTVTGCWNGVTVVDDYGHHPVEIAAVLAAARASEAKRVIAVVQPHRYTRLRDLFEEFCTCFNDADVVIVAAVYPAGEDPIAGIDRDALVDGLRAHGHRNVMPLESAEALPRVIATIAAEGDYVICLGAGNITAWANALPDALRALGGEKPREAAP